MSPQRKAFLACLVAAAAFAVEPALSAPSHRSHSGYRGHGGHHGHSGHHVGHYRGWGLGLAYGIPWGLGWYGSAAWSSPYYPTYAYGPAYPAYGYSCAYREDCWRAAEPTPPSAVVPPPVPGEDGGPTQRPLHLNYCDSAKAWFPHVRSCPGGWRLVRPEYDRAP